MPKYIPIHTNTCSLIQYVPIRPLHIPDDLLPVLSPSTVAQESRSCLPHAAAKSLSEGIPPQVMKQLEGRLQGRDRASERGMEAWRARGNESEGIVWGQSEGASVDTDDVERTSEGASDGGREGSKQGIREGSKHLFGRSFRHRTCFPPWNINRLKWFFFESVSYAIAASCLSSSSSEGAALFTDDLVDLVAKLPNMASPDDD